jgi:UDP-N-acetylglucosamine 2-epimerase (non-hydrolysing)
MQPILMVVGTRPEAIKMLPVAQALRRRGLPLVVLTTGQHRTMLDQVFAAFGEQADRDLALMSPGQSLTDITARVLTALGALLEEERPALVLVHGDTTTAMAAALAAFYARIPIGHVEAGLRSHDLARPFPEELNRVAIDAVADLLFAPTEGAADNLRRESPRARLIEVTGNTGIDALLQVAARLEGNELDKLDLPIEGSRPLILVTGHRRESFGAQFENICEGIARVAALGDVEIVYPVHLNPQVQDCVRARLAGLANVHLIEPVDYITMVALMKRSQLILTDSGGIQEEAPALGKPVLVMREVTERPEAIATGVASLVGTDPDRIASEARRLIEDETYYRERARPVFPYGDGHAAERIAATIDTFMKEQP